MNTKIVVIGSSNTDMVIKSERLPAPGETVIGGTFIMNAGGKGANQAVAAARMGGNITFITKTGNDVFGASAIEGYKKEGINTEYIFRDETNPSGVALITVDGAGENCIVVAPGANNTLLPCDIDKAMPEIETAGIILMQLEIPLETVEYVADIAFKKGIKLILNPAPACYLSDELLSKLYMIIPNRTESEMLSGIKVTDWDSAYEAACIISSKGVNTVVVTLGSMGALVKTGDSCHRIVSYKVSAVDTTAAGDTFCGTLCVAISENRDICNAIEIANKCSSISVTRMGAQASIPYRKDISLWD